MRLPRGISVAPFLVGRQTQKLPGLYEPDQAGATCTQMNLHVQRHRGSTQQNKPGQLGKHPSAAA